MIIVITGYYWHFRTESGTRHRTMNPSDDIFREMRIKKILRSPGVRRNPGPFDLN